MLHLAAICLVRYPRLDSHRFIDISQRLPKQRLSAPLHLLEQVLQVFLTLAALHRFRTAPTWRIVHDYPQSAS